VSERGQLLLHGEDLLGLVHETDFFGQFAEASSVDHWHQVLVVDGFAGDVRTECRVMFLKRRIKSRFYENSINLSFHAASV
jgi:hypothetical protein